MTHPTTCRLTPCPLSAIHLRSYLSARINTNIARLLAVDLEPLLAGYRAKPGVHPWIGEHIGKWMHAASLTHEYIRGAAAKSELRRKLDYAASELIKAQEPDGYLGTYVPEKRFALHADADWDVWSHKYCIIGLLAYAAIDSGRSTPPRDAAILAARRAADLLIATFGPGRRSIITAGTHVGMAATSVIEPIVQLFNITADRAYLDFAHHIVNSFNDADGPHLLDSLLAHGDVARTANAKAYEMLSNCVGLCELYHATANRQCLDASINAFRSVVASQLYITGSASHHERFHPDHDLPNEMAADVGETCVTVTWLQLCDHLFRITGEAAYAHEIERTLYNHLAGAQHPIRGEWCYYTSLDGSKPYTAHTCCCLSSGPRGFAMTPAFVFLREGDDTLVLNLFESADATLSLGARDVSLSLDASFAGAATLTIHTEATFGIKIRIPPWSDSFVTPGIASTREDGWCIIPRRAWKRGDTVRITLNARPHVIRGQFGNTGKAAITYGPFVMCFDHANNPTSSSQLSLASDPQLAADHKSLTVAVRMEHGVAILTTFADAGVNGSSYHVWVNGVFE